MGAAGVTDLLARIEALSIDPPGAALSFAARLGRENGWTPRYAARVVGEYRRFLFLAATATDPVTPSDAVDQAWHLHLTYTRSYWDDLCGGVLGRALHHGPTAGGQAEATRYREQYAATLDRYRRAFGEVPPSDIWPAVEQRFGGDFVRVDRRRSWLVPHRVAALTTLPVAGIALTAAGGVKSGWSGWLGVLLIVALIAMLVASAGRRHKDRKRDRGDADGCGGGAGSDGGSDGCGGGCGGD